MTVVPGVIVVGIKTRTKAKMKPIRKVRKIRRGVAKIRRKKQRRRIPVKLKMSKMMRTTAKAEVVKIGKKEARIEAKTEVAVIETEEVEIGIGVAKETGIEAEIETDAGVAGTEEGVVEIAAETVVVEVEIEAEIEVEKMKVREITVKTKKENPKRKTHAAKMSRQMKMTVRRKNQKELKN